MKDLLVVIVVYNTVIDKVSVLNEFHDISVLLYDNSAEKQDFTSRENVIYVHDSRNLGVSIAYNYAFKYAINNSMKYILLLDQDTRFKREDLNVYAQHIFQYGDEYIYAPIVVGKDKIYSPFEIGMIKNKTPDPSKFKHISIYSLTKKSVINSGLLVPISIIDKIGPYNADIRLDFSDIDFIERYKKYKNEIILLPFKLSHHISGDSVYDQKSEMNRFRYYCLGAANLSKDIEFSGLLFTIFRAARLVTKYQTLKPIKIFIDYYIKKEKIL